MNKKIISKERGQVLVLFVITLVILLGFTALAVDGGMVYSDRRFDQSAADAAAMSGAAAASQYLANKSQIDPGYIFSCADTTLKADTINNAQDAAGVNAFPTLPDQTGVTSPWTHGVSFDCHTSPSYLDVHVKISSETKTSFAHLFFGGHLINTVESTVRVMPTEPYFPGNAIVALDPTCSKDGVLWDGGGHGNTVVHDGNIFSNSCMNKNGMAGGIDVSDPGHGSFYQNGFTCSGHCGNPPFNPPAAPTGGTINVQELYDSLPQVNCDNVADHRSTDLAHNTGPGRYRGGTGDITLASPGLYCIYGDVTLSGSHEDFIGDKVTLYFVDGGIKNTGGANFHLTPLTKADNEALDIRDRGIVGMVILMAPGNTSGLELLGNDYSEITGTVMAPYGQIEIGGTGVSVDYHAQFVGYSVLLHGTTTVEITYQEEDIYHQPAIMEQFK